MTMKTKKTLQHIAAVAVVLLTLCLVFAAPVSATEVSTNTITVETTGEAQEALDNATKGTTIQLVSNVNYGTLYLRPSANDGVTKVVDWVGNDYTYETYSLFEEVTIIGAPGAIVDAIEIEGGTYYNTPHSQSETYPVMLSLIELKNVVIDGVTFIGNGGNYGDDNHGNAISLAGNNIKVDGLTLKNCVLQDSSNNNRLLYKAEGTTTVHEYTYGEQTYTFSPSLKDITVTGCTFNGGYMGLELRETENVVITNNKFNSVGDRNILLTTNSGCTYSGTITITGNTAENSKERFVRASGIGSATLIIKGNTINNYLGKDADYIKVTSYDVTPTIEDNTITYSLTVTDKVGFDSVKVGYTQPEAKTVTISNDGNAPLTIKKPTYENYDVVDFPTDAVIKKDEKLTFKIQPKAGLPVGNYGTTLEVIICDDGKATFEVSFLVYQPSSGGSSKPVEEPVEPEIPEEPETPTEEPVAGEVTVETEVTDGGEVEFEAPVEEPEAGEGDTPAAEDEAKITGVVLPTGTEGKVEFVPISEQAAPEGKETQTKKVFEINVPTYEKGKPATIKFTMTVAELAADGKEAADVALWHFDEETGEWTKLVTSYTIVDGVVYFEAITNDFSPFAIVYEDEPVDEPVDEPETPESPAPVLGLIAALGAAVALRRK